MTVEIRTIKLIITVTGLVLSLLGLLQTMIDRNIEHRTRKCFMGLFACLELYIICILTRELTYTRTGYGWITLSKGVFFGQAFFASLLTVLITVLLLY